MKISYKLKAKILKPYLVKYLILEIKDPMLRTNMYMKLKD